jgi:acetylornithine deacetylase
MGPVLTGLDELDRRLRAHPTHPLLKSGSVHASIISGGQEMSTYPARCNLLLERRTVPGETRETVAREIEGILTAEATYEVGFSREPFEVGEDEPIVAMVRDQARRHLAREPRLYGETYWADTGLIHAAGIPTLLFGPGGAGAHAVEEWADLDQLAACVEVLVAVAKEFCGEPAGTLS